MGPHLRGPALLPRIAVAALLPLIGSWSAPPPAAPQDAPPETEESIRAGKVLYEQRCMACHGIEGDGNGLAAPYLNPPPRDFTDIIYKIHSTASGERPLDADLFRTLTNGMPGTAMPAWTTLSADERWQLVHYVKTFAAEDFAEELDEEALVELPATEGLADEITLQRGAKLYEILKCGECHGETGRGNGPSATTLQDEFGNPMWPADLTRTDLFRGGDGVIDIARSFMTGLGTTPMPSYMDYFAVFAEAQDLPPDQQILRVSADENALALSHYVLSMADGQKPRREALEVQATFTDEEIPDDPDSPLWDEADWVELKLSTQLTVPPRWPFATIDEIAVAALYNERELGLSLEWGDHTEDLEHAEDAGELAGEPGLAASEVILPTRDDLAEFRNGTFADALSVLFPPAAGEGTRKPYFAMGAPDAPLQALSFRADRGAQKSTRRGFDAPPEDVEELFANARFDDGRWKLVLKMTIEDDERFLPGNYLPIAFAAWDGGNGENGSRCSLSSWYWFVVKPRPSVAPLLWAALAFVLFGALELRWIKRLRAA